jgi:uncharacterized membrane protein
MARPEAVLWIAAIHVCRHSGRTGLASPFDPATIAAVARMVIIADFPFTATAASLSRSPGSRLRHKPVTAR